jgi:hypothetical protein
MHEPLGNAKVIKDKKGQGMVPDERAQNPRDNEMQCVTLDGIPDKGRNTCQK